MTVDIYIAICLTIIVIAIGVVSTVLVITLFQIKRTVKALERVAQEADRQLLKIGSISGALSGFASAASGRLGRTVSLAAGLVSALAHFFRRDRVNRPDEDNDPL